MNGKDFIKAEAYGKTLCVFGIDVRAPHCPVCKKDTHMTVKMREDGWVYHCEKCKKDLSYEDVLRGTY